MPVGKIIGEFEIEQILMEHPSKLWQRTKKYAGITEEFYDELSSSISHAYKLDFDESQKCTTAKEGYFWKSNKAEAI